MKRSDSERVRLKHSISRMRATLDNLERGLAQPGSSSDGAEALTKTAMEIALQVARLDAYELAEQDAAEAARVNERDRAIWEARCRGDSVAELAARYNLLREKITQICVREQAGEQRRRETSAIGSAP